MTDLIEVHTNALAGAALDWAVAQVEGIEVAIAEPHYGTGWRVYRPESGGKYSPSTDWAVGGPLLERHYIELTIGDEDYWAERTSTGPHDDRRQICAGPTMLMAACRAIVVTKLGTIVRVPKELMP